MARTALPATRLVPNSGQVNPAGASGFVDGHYVDLNARTGVLDQVELEECFLEFTVATATTNVTVKAGEYPPALANGLGDLVYSATVGSHKIGPLESGRFVRRNGQVWIDYQTPANVSGIRFTQVPRNT